MIREWNYKNLPIRLQHLLGITALIFTAFWAQQGFTIEINHILFLASNYLLWFLMFPMIHQLVRFSRPSTTRLWITKTAQAIMIIIIQWILSNVLLSVLKMLIMEQHFMQDWQELSSYLFPSIATRVIDLALFSGLLSWLSQQRAIADHQIKEALNQSLLHQSKLESLKGQLNPHFLFNALHSINSQIGHDDEKASEMNLRFSHLLRKLLTINQQDEHTMKEEMDFVEMYLDIEKERFRDRLTIQLVVDDRAANCVVPTMVLQPLIENAFKHGISKITTPSVLEISVNLQQNELSIQVKNECPSGDSEQPGEGIGLRNLQDRLELYYDQPIALEAGKNGKFFLSKLTLPA